MKKRKERTLKELYDATEKLSEPEMTPVLKGNCRIQGPVDELDRDIQTYTGLSRAENFFGKHYLSDNVRMKAESGKCNVCFAPCSSCMHFNQAVSFMESKTEDEFSDETCQGKVVSRCSFSDVDVLPPSKSRSCNGWQPTASETSNLLSTSSSHDSFSENAESKATMRIFDISDASEDVEMLPKLLSGGTIGEDQLISKPRSVAGQKAVTFPSCRIASDLVQRTFSTQCEEHKGFEYHGDNISCISGASDAKVPIGGLNVDIEKKDVSCSSVSVSCFLPEGLEKTVHVQTASGCLSDFHCEIEESHNNFRRPSTFTRESIQKKIPTITENEAFPQKSGPPEIPFSKDVSLNNSSPKVQSTYSNSQSGKSLFCSANAKNLEENSCSHLQGEPSECSTEYVELSLGRVLISGGFADQKTATRNSLGILPESENNKPSVIRSSSSGASVKVYPCLESETASESRDPQVKAMTRSDQNKEVEKSHELLEVSETLSQFQLIDESNGSDIVEDDVNVCDICGDAGREELLAFCSRCSDGAEHIYCMQIMLDKVPEGDWLCEGCKLKEESDNQEQDKSELISGISKASCLNEKDQNSGGTGNVNSKLFLKLDVKDPDAEGTKVSSSPHLPSKRKSDNLEVASAAKRQVLETSVGSPKAFSPGKKSVLSRESSSGNLDKGKVKPSHQIISSGSHTANNCQGTAFSSTPGHNPLNIQSRLQSPRGTLKSSSINTLNLKPKVKLVQEDVPLKQKFAKEAATSDTKKEGFVRTISKSLSFKATSSGRLNATESKVKMLSSSFSRIEDLRGLKQAQEQNLIEKKSSFKSNHPLVRSPMPVFSVSTPKAYLKITSRLETMSSPSSATNYLDLKAVRPDVKLNTLSKPTSHLANKGSEIAVACVKRHSSCSSSALGAPSSSGRYISTEQKPGQVISNDEPTSSSSLDADKPCINPDANLRDGLPQSWESTNQDGKIRELPVSRPRQIVSIGGQENRCNEINHVAKVFPIGSPRVSVLEASSARSSREVMNKSNTLKEAVEAAVLKKPGLDRKNGLLDQSDELSMSCTDLSSDAVSKDQLSTFSSCLRKLNAGDGTNDGKKIFRGSAAVSKDPLSTSSSCFRKLNAGDGMNNGQNIFRGSAADSNKTTAVNDVKKLAVHPVEAIHTPKAGDQDACIHLEGNKMKPSVREFPCLASAVAVPSEVSTIPEHDYIWKGGFEVQRSGILPNFCDGIQAHLSTCASPRVLEVVNKFPCKVLMEEVPRLNTWPVQFQENPATDDNIALYFFAKDLESYERNYKSFLDKIIKNDLALKGNFDGIELLIFPSNQLPEKSQRWNMLFFLWGVFRGRRENFLEDISGYQRKLSQASSDVLSLDQDMSDHVVAVSQKVYLSGHMDKDLSICNQSFDAQQAAKSTTSRELSFLSSSGKVDRNCDTKVSSLGQKSVCLPTNFNQCGTGLNTSLSGVSPSNVQLCTEMKGIGTSLKERMNPVCKQVAELQSCTPATRQSSSFNNVLPVPVDDSLGPDILSCSSKILPVGTSLAQEFVTERSIDDGKIQERIKDGNRDQVRVQDKVKDEELMEIEIALEGDTLCDPMEKGQSNLESNNKKRLHSDSAQMVSQLYSETSTSRSPAIPWKEQVDHVLVDGERKCNECLVSVMNCCDSSRDQNSSGRFPSQIHDMGPPFSIKEQRYDGAYEDSVIPESLRVIERHFFSVDLGPMKDHRLGDSSVPWQVLSSGDDDRLGSEVPNLELALGAEKRSPKQGILPVFVGMVDKKNNNDKLLTPMKSNKDDDNDILASLSLSLAFPFSD